MFIKKVVRAPYICTVPGGGVRAIKCYPDAEILIVNGKQVGYSRKESALIATLNVSGPELKAAKNSLAAIYYQKKRSNITTDKKNNQKTK